LLGDQGLMANHCAAMAGGGKLLVMLSDHRGAIPEQLRNACGIAGFRDPVRRAGMPPSVALPFDASGFGR